MKLPAFARLIHDEPENHRVYVTDEKVYLLDRSDEVTAIDMTMLFVTQDDTDHRYNEWVWVRTPDGGRAHITVATMLRLLAEYPGTPVQVKDLGRAVHTYTFAPQEAPASAVSSNKGDDHE